MMTGTGPPIWPVIAELIALGAAMWLLMWTLTAAYR